MGSLPVATMTRKWGLWCSMLAVVCASAVSAAAAEVVDNVPVEGSVRLAGGNTDAGRVEVLHNGTWGWICVPPAAPGGDDGADWLSKDFASVVCRQLGLRHGLGTMRMANGEGAGISPISRIRCTGKEPTVASCAQVLRGQGGAYPPQDACISASGIAGAGVRCTNFAPEDQPAILSAGKAVLNLALLDPLKRISCELNLTGAAAIPHGPPSFRCSLLSLNSAEPKRDTCAASNRECSDGGPNPFEALTAADVFVFDRAMEAHVRNASARVSAAVGVGGLPVVRHMNWSAIGMELSTGFGSAEALLARSVYLSPIARVLLDLDSDVVGLTGLKASGGVPAAAAAAVFQQLENDGVAKLGDLALPPEAVREALAALGPLTTADRLAAVRSRLPSLEGWLRANLVLHSAIASYFGGHAILHGYKVVHLPAVVSPEAFISAHWHHDRAGRRLKLFILLNDVDPDHGHPTEVAKGSHKTLYYWHEEFEQSRYRDSFVRESFDTVRLAGKAGSGYVFDTNSLHRGTPTGSRPRDVIVVEYHQAAKCGVLSTMGLNIPCPSGDQRPLNWYFGEDGASRGPRVPDSDGAEPGEL